MPYSEDPHPEAALVAARVEIASLRAEVAKAQQYELDQRAEVERLKTARDGFYDDTVELRKQLIALRADHEAELAFEEKAHGQTLAERDAARADLKRLQTENERLVGMTGNMRIENADLRAEVERLKTQLAFSADTRDHFRARIAELELLLRHVLCQADANSIINLDAIRAALAGTKEGDKSDDAR